MQIDKIRVHKVNLPFSFDFSHSLRRRSYVRNIVAEVIANQGEIAGYGEGAPRSYVTGESQESAVRSIHRFTQEAKFPWDLHDISQIWHFIDSLSRGKEHNAAICAIETALLDALGKHQRIHIAEYFPQSFFANIIYYGVGIPLGDKKSILELCRLIKSGEIHKLKLKMGKDIAQNMEIFEAVRRVFGDHYDLKIDVNGAWNSELAAKHLSLIRDYRVKVVEQPMMPGKPDIADFASHMKADGVALMADESACSLEDVKRVVKEGFYNMINVRLSKCGGFRKSFRIIDFLRRNEIPFQIGCHLGESGLLSAAGRALSLLCGDAAYYDGSYDEFLLKENITTEDVTFGPGGLAGPLNRPGLGVIVNRDSLDRLRFGAFPLTIVRP